VGSGGNDTLLAVPATTPSTAATATRQRLNRTPTPIASPVAAGQDLIFGEDDGDFLFGDDDYVVTRGTSESVTATTIRLPAGDRRRPDRRRPGSRPHLWIGRGHPPAAR